MKNVALFCAVAGMALGAMAAGDGLKFKFSSSGDTYADGTPVQDGEAYALVWVKSGASFAGFNADGTLRDAASNDVVGYSVAQGGGCVTTVFIADEDRDAGTYSMYLLDTRATVADAEGNVAKKAVGLVDGRVAVVNEAVSVANAELSVASDAVAKVDGTSAPAVAAAPVPDSQLPQPTVSAFALADGGATLTVEGTVRYAQYTVYGGATPAAIDTAKPLATFLNGSAGGTITLTVGAVGDNRFFKVSTK